MDFKKFSDGELVTKLKTLVIEERKITTEILHFLREAEARRLFAFWGYPSLFEFCTNELGYSAGAAQRRIESMRLLKSLGEAGSKKIEEGIQEGKINLTQLSLLQTFVRNKEKKENQKINPAEKLSWINQMANHSTRECEKILQAIDPSTPLISKEKERVISGDRIEIKFSVSDALLKKLQRIRELRAHVHPKMTYEEMLEYLAEVALEKIDPERKAFRKFGNYNDGAGLPRTLPSFAGQDGRKSKAKRQEGGPKKETRAATLPMVQPETAHGKRIQTGVFPGIACSAVCHTVVQENKTKIDNLLPAPEIKTGKKKEPGDPEEQRPRESLQGKRETSATSQPQRSPSPNRTIPAHIKRKVWLRDNGCCTYRSSATGKVCESRFGLEFEHIQPFAIGGPHTESNLTLHCKLCRARHNPGLGIMPCPKPRASF